MPGDSIYQKITVKNEAYKEVKVKIYMRSLGAHPDSENFLSKLRLSVEKSNEKILVDDKENDLPPEKSLVYQCKILAESQK